MSTANFKTMENFPLYVTDAPEVPVCPLCGAQFEDENSHECECCDYTGEPEMTTDPFFYDDLFYGLKEPLEELNDSLLFYRVSLESGYYCGVQFYVEEKTDLPQELDNEDCRYNWDLCRSVAIRKEERERRRIIRKLDALALTYGFQKIVCVGIFSNGEAIYAPATERNIIKAAAVVHPYQAVTA